MSPVMKAQLRPQQALGAGRRRCEDELDVAATPRLELQLGAQCGLQAPVAGGAVADAQHLGDRPGVVGARRIDECGAEELAPAALQLLFESGQHPVSPGTRRHQRDSAAVMIVQYAPRREARLVLGRQRVLIELRRCRLFRGQEVQRQ